MSRTEVGYMRLRRFPNYFLMTSFLMIPRHCQVNTRPLHETYLTYYHFTVSTVKGLSVFGTMPTIGAAADARMTVSALLA